MATTIYTKNYPADYPDLVTAAPNAKTLESSILYDPAITIALESINIGIVPGVSDFAFADPLPAPDEAAFDAIIAAHTGEALYTDLKSAFSVTRDTVAIVEDVNWQLLAKVTTTPTFFVDAQYLDKLIGRLVGSYSATAGGLGELPQLKIVETVAGQGDEDKLPPTDMAEQAMSTFGISTTTPPRNGYHNIYCVYARLNGAAAMSIEWTTLSMIDIRVVGA